MRTRCLLAMLVCCWAANAAEPGFRPIDLRWVTIERPTRWDSPPKELHLKQKTAPAGIIVVYPSGNYAYVGCYLIQQADGAVSMSRGDGFVVKIGRWVLVDGRLTVASRAVYRTIFELGKVLPEPDRTEHFEAALRKDGWHLTINGRIFTRMLVFKILISSEP